MFGNLNNYGLFYFVLKNCGYIQQPYQQVSYMLPNVS